MAASRSPSRPRRTVSPATVPERKPPLPPQPSGWQILWKRCTASCSTTCVLERFKKLVPAAEWVPRYRWRQQLAGDLSAGLVVAVMHVPQGLGYALLAGAAPVGGLYVALLPVFVYALFGTSRHISMGTFAVTCLMTGQIVSEHAGDGVTPEEVVSMVSLWCGLLLLALWVLRLGALCRVLSETLVSAITTGAAVHVFTSQLLEALGVARDAPKHHGLLRLVYTYGDLFSGSLPPRLPAIATALITIAVLVVYQLAVPKLVGRWLSAELVVLVVTTVTASQVDFSASYIVGGGTGGGSGRSGGSATAVHPELIASANEESAMSGEVVCMGVDTSRDECRDDGGKEAMWNMSVVGPVPSGLPKLRDPVSDWKLMGAVAVGSLGVAAVSFAVSTSMALLLARGRYRVRLNQELLAQGLAAVASAVSGGVPPSASLSRSLLQRDAGGSTQLAGLVSCAVLLAVVQGAGPLFEPLPRAVLAAVIIVALRGMVMAASRDVPRMFRLSLLDGGVWVASFLGVVLLDTALGLLLGVALSLLFLVVRGAAPRVQVLGMLAAAKGPPAYVELDGNAAAVERPGVRVVRLLAGAALAFPSRDELREQVFGAVGVEPARVLELQRLALAAEPDSAQQRDLLERAEQAATPQWRVRAGAAPQPRRLTHVVLDLSTVTSCDFSSARSLELLAAIYEAIDVTMVLVLQQPLYSLESVLSVDAAVRMIGGVREEEGED
ncbi:solute carrier family 26 member 6-like [Schistocerca americana]|uniref:solute carrier family 26 member 6-like n=1 Tax=Schistocerca americana TaxID=7009 RepID=UPI001F4F7EB8|nr:solute carrier family 26 member 6-like [Schistocerca americana]